MLPVGDIINNVLTLIVWPVFAGASIIMFIWAGFIFLTAQGEPAKISQAKKAVIWGVVGLGVGLAGFSAGNIVKTILGV